jgi:GNAT superfamily N-acetyltransferase
MDLKAQLKAALLGATKAEGGLNVTDMRKILASNGLDSSGLRDDLVKRLDRLMNTRAKTRSVKTASASASAGKKAKAKASASASASASAGKKTKASASIVYYKQELVDDKFGYGTFVKYTAFMNDEEEIGYLTGLYHRLENTLELLFLNVDETYRGQGIALSLLSYAIKEGTLRKANIVVDDESAYGPNMCTLPVDECHKRNIYVKIGFQYIHPTTASMTYKGKPLNPQSSAFTVRPQHLNEINISEQQYVKL